MLIESEKKYYSRQLLRQDIGELGQIKLKKAKVACVGAGAIASSSLSYLAGMGIGYIRIIDADIIADHNLHRQIMYQFTDIGEKKVDCAKTFLNNRNPYIKIETCDEFLTSENANDLLKEVDLILDATDNQETRKIINDFSVQHSTPFIFTAVQDFQLQYALINPSIGPCLNCFLNLENESTFSCSENGILNIVPGVAGLFQAQLAFRYFLENHNRNLTELYVYDLLNCCSNNFFVFKNLNCICSKKK